MYSQIVQKCLYDIYGHIDINNPIDSSFIDFVFEDKSNYPSIETIGLKDPNNNFKVGDSGGILMNWNFIIVRIHRR